MVPQALKPLEIALIHLKIHYKDPDTNRKNLLQLNHEAAFKGAQLILNTELPVSGYSFLSREDVSKYVETENGATITGLASIAREHKVYIGTGLAERDEATGIYYNSAFVLGPDGNQLCRYRKINAETRWACPGYAKQDGTFDTPWGRMGVLICSDTYYGLMPRSMALKGVDFLWVPANWPPSGLDPRELWRARALENGFFLAVCARSGNDRITDSFDGFSCVYDPQGDELLAASSDESRVFWVEIPLDERGKLAGIRRRQRLKSRDPSLYRHIYLDLRLIENLTPFHDLPDPGPLHIHCIVPEIQSPQWNFVEQKIKTSKKNGANLFVFPASSLPSFDKIALSALATHHHIALYTAFLEEKNNKTLMLVTPDELHEWHSGEIVYRNSEFPFPMIQYGPARIGMVPFESFVHPELALALSKRGCDLGIISEVKLEDTARLLCEVKTIEKIAVAVCALNGASIAMIPEGHQRWEGQALKGPGICFYTLDTSRTRKKNFQDRVDFELLLKTG
jgi:predicted amidohydrolase